MQIPILSSLQWWVAGAILAAAVATSGTVGYKTGAAFQAKDDAATTKTALDKETARADAAEVQREAQAAQYANELKARDLRDELAAKLYNDTVTAMNKSNADLVAARKAIKEQRNDPNTRAILDTAIPADLRRRVCDAKGETCS